VCLLDFYTTQNVTSPTVSIECISWLIKVLIIMMHGGIAVGYRLFLVHPYFASNITSSDRCVNTSLNYSWLVTFCALLVLCCKQYVLYTGIDIIARR